MTIEDHLASRETAKRMKELGWDKECVYCYRHIEDSRYQKAAMISKPFYSTERDVYAPLATEIMEELPMEIKAGSKNETAYLVIYPGAMNSVHYEGYDCGESWNFFLWEHETSLAEALALLWCELKEKGII